MKKSVFLEMILETVIFIIISTFFFWNLARPVSQNTIVVISALVVAASILIYLSGHYFGASVFNVNILALAISIFSFSPKTGLTDTVIFIAVLVVFLVISFISITERSHSKILIYRSEKAIFSLVISFALVFISGILLTFSF